MAISLKPLRNQVVVITGASSGIGLVTARMAAKQGAKLVLAARNEDALRQLVDEIRGLGGQAIYVVADVGQEEDVNRIAQRAIAEFGGFDTWVNNAGVSIFGRCMDVSIPDMKRMFDTNFWGVVYGSRAAVNHFKQRQSGSGALINVGSFLGDRAVAVQSTYSASKHALHGWTDALRTELEAEGAPVSVTLIHPGRIDTPYNEHARSYMPKQPAHRGMIYPPEAVAEAILYSAEHPKRDMFVGFQAKALAVLAGISPRLTDKLIELWAFPSQQSDRPSRDREDNALYHAGYGMHERGTHQGWIRSGSLYVKAEKHPVTTTIIVAGLGTLIWWLTSSAV
ncbi:short-chain dehydrogenase/reductase SDR [Scytonema sp. HK-05]|uniref:SDR family oxidoreductase n=1 Tax=Scytonema sp. HK-05 TaxID=1137095 RepID=UPI00093686A0|nr:SDR family oxidoreductase [Scytonema sp. HK-05]OKH58708.1 oxidoreductase [Scytonema sp. HK-05]BAY43371.1 short-chain dehydrogenase/reductase SDR [Scytonema sp. HK-05]